MPGRRRSRRERFIQEAPRRVERALEALDKIQDCGNRRSYEYTEGEVEHMISTLRAKVDRVAAAFETEELSFDFTVSPEPGALRE